MVTPLPRQKLGSSSNSTPLIHVYYHVHVVHVVDLVFFCFFLSFRVVSQ